MYSLSGEGKRLMYRELRTVNSPPCLAGHYGPTLTARLFESVVEVEAHDEHQSDCGEADVGPMRDQERDSLVRLGQHRLLQDQRFSSHPDCNRDF